MNLINLVTGFLWNRITQVMSWFKRNPTKEPSIEPSTKTPQVTIVKQEELKEEEKEEAPKTEPPLLQPNRQTRRAMSAAERARRKRDKFVEPKGPKPTPITRKPKQTKPIGPPPAESDEVGILDEDGTLIKESELYGIFNFRDTILDQLDRYWVYLARMKKHSPDTYDLYSQIGATIVPPIVHNLDHGIKPDRWDKKDFSNRVPELSAWWKLNRPAFGCFTYGMTSRVEEDEIRMAKGNLKLWIPKFMYFEKYSAPPSTVEATTNGDVYKMAIWWDKPRDEELKSKWGIPEEFAVYINKDGTQVRVLKMMITESLKGEGKRTRTKTGKRGRKTPGFSTQVRTWGIPGNFKHQALRHNETVEQFLAGIFVDAANIFDRSNYSMIRVSVTNKDLTAVFGVDVKRVPYFFQDRDIELTEGGVKKRIFHIVRPHERKTKNGVSYIPFQFRGLRKFKWADYDVLITVPGRDHYLLQEFNVGAVSDEWIDKPLKGKWLTQSELGKRIAKEIKDGIVALEA